MVNNDENEFEKPGLRVDKKINIDVKVVLKEMVEKIQSIEAKEYSSWLKYCLLLKKEYPIVDSGLERNPINSYFLVSRLAALSRENQHFVSDAGSSYYVSGQALNYKFNQRDITSGAFATMGVAIPMAIGAACYDKNAQIIVVTGDGSLELNIQELKTVSQNNLNIKIFVINNGGYASIRESQDAYSDGRYTEVEDILDFSKVADAFEMKYEIIDDYNNLDKQIINITPANEKAIISESALLERISTLEEELSKPVKFIQGCTNEMALNYNPDANLDDNSCIILDANEANIRFGSYSSIDSTIEIFLQTGIGSVNLEQISFITVGFTINEIISGKFIKNDYTIEIQHIDDYSSEVVFYSNEYSTTFNTNYSEKLLFVAKVTGFTDTFCLSNIVVNPPSQMSSTRLPSGLFKELADGLIIQNTPCKKNVIASKDFPVPDDLVLEDIILFKNIDYYESIVRFTFYTSGLDWNKLDIMIQGTKLNGEIELDSLKYTGFVYDWVLMEINIEEFRNSNVCIIKAVLEDDEGNTKKLNAGNCERF